MRDGKSETCVHVEICCWAPLCTHDSKPATWQNSTCWADTGRHPCAFSLFRHILCMMHMLHQHDSEPQERWIVIYCNTTMDQMDRNSCLPMVALHRRGVPGPSSTRGHGIARCQPIARMNPDHILRKHGRQQCRHLHHVLQHLQSVNCLKKSTYGTDCVLVLHAGDTDRSQMQPCSASRHPFDCHQRYGAGFS